ncbi:MAG: MerR family transcriptional regulator [Bacteroidales bacterium]|nr:MerR family transcriptional regulator [Lachnoclostridium sp.]MCM1385533.1 MerR family transcriptional regulator [Lachnoclostridium sp.]MCM1465491.1 MerR family transcriptional regulator [Bacteroidales bacterium]
MSMYTTGELAKKCNVSVRTVQYYDERGILVPSKLSEGGRRLFTEKDVVTLETICFLKNLGISLKSIADILNSSESKEVVSLLLEQQSSDLEKDISEKNEQLLRVKRMQDMMQNFEELSENSIHDISIIMESRKNLSKIYKRMLMIALPAEALEVGSFVYGILSKNWLPFAISIVLVIVCVLILFPYWYQHIKYLCPQCHTTFKPSKMEAMFANHTPKTRKVTCPCCRKKVWCIEMEDAGNSDR